MKEFPREHLSCTCICLFHKIYYLQKCLRLRYVPHSSIVLFIPCLQSPLWCEALDILKLSVSNSASIMAPRTHGRAIPIMDISTQALPGPTFAFNVDLSKGSSDVELLKDVVTRYGKQPQASL